MKSLWKIRSEIQEKEEKMKTLKVVSFVLAAMISVGTFAGCELLDQGSKTPTYEVTVEAAAPNAVVNSAEAIDEGAHSPKTMTSFYDELNIWYYIVYLGQIEDFIFQVHRNFEYTRAISDPEIEETKITTERVKKTYQTIVTSSTKNVITNEISSSLDSSVDVKYGGFSVGVKSNISAKYQDVWTGSLVEVNDNYVENETTETTVTSEKYKIKGDYLVQGMWYCYATVATVDVYAAIAYDPSKNAITRCEYFSDVVSYGGKKMFASEKNNFMQTNGKFDFDFDSVIGEFTKPTELIRTYKDITEKYVHPNSNVKVSSSRTVYIQVPLTMYAEAKAAGYTAITVNYSFGYQKGTPVIFTKAAMLHLTVGPSSQTTWQNKPGVILDTGSEGIINQSFSVGINAQYLNDYKTLYFRFVNENVANEYYVKVFNAEIIYTRK